MAERDGTEPDGYGDWRSLEQAIKDAAKKAAAQAGPGVSAASVDAQVRQARYDRFLSRIFAEGERSEWLLKGGMSMLARVPRSRTTKDVDLAALHASDLAGAQTALAALAEADLGDHLAFRLVRSTPTGLGENQPGVATRRYVFACIDADYGTQVDTVTVDVVVGPPPVGRPEVVEPAAPAPSAGHLPVPALPGRRPGCRQGLRDDGHPVPRRQAQQPGQGPGRPGPDRLHPDR
jgi:hypothetical protein